MRFCPYVINSVCSLAKATTCLRLSKRASCFLSSAVIVGLGGVPGRESPFWLATLVPGVDTVSAGVMVPFLDREYEVIVSVLDKVVEAMAPLLDADKGKAEDISIAFGATTGVTTGAVAGPAEAADGASFVLEVSPLPSLS
jgi:hypothetical protein